MHSMKKNLVVLEGLFGGHGRVAILRVLAAHEKPLTGRQVAELAGLSERGSAYALEHLASLGVVSQLRVGRAITQELNRSNVLVTSIVLPAIEAEAALQSHLLEALTDAFEAVSVSLVIFGSVARGEAEPGSDLDVLVVTKDERDAARAHETADQVGHDFYRRFAMPLSVMVVSLSALPKTPTAYLAAARYEGVLVCGRPLDELLADAAR
jgi:predicted nucleotidyltransferase